MELNPPEAVLEITRRLNERGFEAWAVGGAVRDRLLGIPHADWDLATNARPEQVRRLFRRTVPVGIEHGTVGVLARDGVLYEVTTFRRDVSTDGRHAVVEFADNLEEDLTRRDFTINALAWQPLTGELRDPFSGLADLRAKVLRTVGRPADRFAEDYLRVLRALRFAGQYELRIDPATWEALRAAVPQLTRLSAERVREELFKILSKARRASAAFRLYAQAGALRDWYPELDALIGLPVGAGPDGREQDAWARTLRAVDVVPRTRLRLRLAALLHAIGLPAARPRDLRGEWHFAGHSKIGARRAAEVLRRLKCSNADIERVSRLIELQEELFPPAAADAVVRRWLASVQPEYVNDFFRLCVALARAAERSGEDLIERWCTVRRVLGTRPPLTIHELAIDGRDLKTLGLSPGPEFGAILRAVHGRVLEDPSLNQKDTLMQIVREELLP